MAAAALTHILSPEFLSASGRAAVRMSLPVLQSRMKVDPEGYEAELLFIYRHFESTLHLFRQQSALSLSSDPVLSKDLGDLLTFLAHMIPFYPLRLAVFSRQVSDLLRTDAPRCINKKHRNEAKNQKLQNILFKLLQGEEELRARRSLVVLCDLHRRKVWFDDRTANAICNACFHSSSRVMISALSFLLGYERIEDDADDSEASSSEDDESSQNPQVVLSREEVYKEQHKGTASSKRKRRQN